MSSIHPNYEYDIFISYRQNDNKRDHWVTNFVETLKDELEATLKNPVSIYFDENPHDGLLETHDVDKSLEKKLKCLIFIPIISQTYCDPKCFAWEHELVPFVDLATKDELDMNITLANGNVASRILPIKIHELDAEDTTTIEEKIGGVLRAIEFIYKEPGVNRPLKVTDERNNNQNQTDYGNQVNKVANAIKQITAGIQSQISSTEENHSTLHQIEKDSRADIHDLSSWGLAKKRNLPRVALAYVSVGLFLLQIFQIISHYIPMASWGFIAFSGALILGLPVAVFLAWKFENSPTGFISTKSVAAHSNPFTPSQKKPFSNNRSIFLFIILVGIASLGARYYLLDVIKDEEASIAIIPFRNYTGKADLENFGLGLANEIRTQLSLSKRFKNISSEQSTLKYYDSDEDPVKIGDALNVKYLILGNFQLSGEKIKVSMEMVNTSNGRSELQFPAYYTTLNTYTEVFNIQNEIATIVLAKFALETNETISAPTQSILAFTYHGQGKKFLEKGWFNDQDVFTAIDYFEKAIQTDSTYLSAWVGLTNAKLKYLWAVSQNYYQYTRTTINLESIESDLEFIKNNFNDSWETNYITGLYYYNGLFNYDKGLEYFLKALNENPEEIDILNNIAAIYRRKLELEKSLKYRLKAIEINPLVPDSWNELSYIFLINGEYENQKKALYRAWELDGNTDESFNRIYRFHKRTGRITELPLEIQNERPAQYKKDKYIEDRNWDGLQEFITEDTTLNNSQKSSLKVLMYSVLGKRDSVQFYAKSLEDGGFDGAQANAVLGNIDAAMDSVKKWHIKNVDGGDKAVQGFLFIQKIFIYTLADDFKNATETLQEMNNTLPEFGHYLFLNHPQYDRAKKEYPPFNDAINLLRLPQKLGGINPLEM